VRLRDVSIQMDVLDDLIAVWAVGTKGDVLYRHGVTGDCPQSRINLGATTGTLVVAVWK